MPNNPATNIPHYLTDSELINRATLSADPLTRRLAELAAAAEPWQNLPQWIAEGGPDAIEELDDEHSAMTHALDRLDAWDSARSEVDEPLIDWYEELAEDARSGKLQYVMDCCICGGDGRAGELHPKNPDTPCPECKGAGFTTEPVELP